MLKPPFTVLILKNSRQPVTVRITTGMVAAFVAIIAITGIVSGSLFTYLLINGDRYAGIQKKTTENGSFIETETPDRITKISGNHISISELEIMNGRNEPTGISLHVDNGEKTDKLYVWMIVNDDADHEAERLVLPRNPLIKGVPVDYRNGIPCSPGKRHVRAEFEEPPPVSINSVRVLVYSDNGGILTDKRYKGIDTARL